MRLFLLTGMVLLPSLGYAADTSGSAPAGQQSGASVYEPFFKKMDVNKDGVISLSESFYNTHVRRQFKTLDADRDGYVSSVEFSKYQAPTGSGAPAQSANYRQNSAPAPESPQEAAALHDEPPTKHMQEALSETAQGKTAPPSTGQETAATQPKPGGSQNGLSQAQTATQTPGGEASNKGGASDKGDTSNSVNYSTSSPAQPESPQEAAALHDEPPTKHMQEVLGETDKDNAAAQTKAAPTAAQDSAVQSKPNAKGNDLPETKAISEVLENDRKPAANSK